jgi:hypothetical protein
VSSIHFKYCIVQFMMSFSLQRARLSSRAVHVEFVVDKLALEQVFIQAVYQMSHNALCSVPCEATVLGTVSSPLLINMSSSLMNMLITRHRWGQWDEAPNLRLGVIMYGRMMTSRGKWRNWVKMCASMLLFPLWISHEITRNRTWDLLMRSQWDNHLACAMALHFNIWCIIYFPVAFYFSYSWFVYWSCQ